MQTALWGRQSGASKNPTALFLTVKSLSGLDQRQHLFSGAVQPSDFTPNFQFKLDRRHVPADRAQSCPIIVGQFGVCPFGQFGKRHFAIGQHSKDRLANRVELPFRYARRSGSPDAWSSTNNPFFRHSLSFELPLISLFIAQEATEFQRQAARLLKLLH